MVVVTSCRCGTLLMREVLITEDTGNQDGQNRIFGPGNPDIAVQRHSAINTNSVAISALLFGCAVSAVRSA